MSQDNGKRILIADGDQKLAKDLAGFLYRSGFKVHVALTGTEALSALEKGEDFDLVITAMNLPGAGGMEVLRGVKRRDAATPVVIISSQGTVENAVAAMKEGAAEFFAKAMVTTELLEEVASRWLRHRSQGSAPSGKSREIVTKDPRMGKLLEMAAMVADSRATVLISGESGTGKELFARYLHQNSSRRTGPFVAVNCASLPEGLLESELFGHEKGAFTGAIARKAGKFELAAGGTLLLDEISEMVPALQAKLLRVLQENEIDRVGGKKPVPVDVRVVATTNREMKEFVEKGEFREDLFYRLNVIPLKVPALRERPGDLTLLTNHFLSRYAGENNKDEMTLSNGAAKQLGRHTWPGNVRELQNTMERAVLLAPGNEITLESLLFDDQMPTRGSTLPQWSVPGGAPPTLREAEKHLISQALDHTEGNRTHAAKVLGISVRTLRNKLNEYKAAQTG